MLYKVGDKVTVNGLHSGVIIHVDGDDECTPYRIRYDVDSTDEWVDTDDVEFVEDGKIHPRYEIGEEVQSLAGFTSCVIEIKSTCRDRNDNEKDLDHGFMYYIRERDENSDLDSYWVHEDDLLIANSKPSELPQNTIFSFEEFVQRVEVE